jgi:hypothetical protein
MMILSQLKSDLAQCKDAAIRFRLPDDSLSPAHAHITEVGLVTKEFIDCGGTARIEKKCQMQSWVADDTDHRLSAGKLLSIIEKATSILGGEDLPVELEHDVGFAAQFSVVGAVLQDSELILMLEGRHTACLAPDICCPPNESVSIVTLGRK